ncbi:MAG: hypothetical protein K2X91_06220, partial [Thermoleophilia bacterium]|nr:hypothetical protein [Thermoleophilia bacterium]
MAVIKTAMTRVALAILSSGPDNTRLTPPPGWTDDRLFEQLINRPADPIPGAPWPHADPYWSEQGPYQRNHPPADWPDDPSFRDALREVGLFRRDAAPRDGAEPLAFVHDSLIYHLAGKVALRDHLGPGLPAPGSSLGPEWAIRVAHRLRDNPPTWERAAEFLGAALRPEELLALARELVAVPPRPGTEGTTALLHRALHGRARAAVDRDGTESLLDDLEEATARFEGRRWPEALPSIVRHWIRANDTPTTRSTTFLDESLRSLDRERRLWLESDPPPPRPIGLWHRLHTEVTAVVELDDGRIASAGAEGRIVVWDPVRNDYRLIFDHGSRAELLVALEGGGAATGGRDGRVALW